MGGPGPAKEVEARKDSQLEPVHFHWYSSELVEALQVRLNAGNVLDFTPRHGANAAAMALKNVRYVAFAMSKAHKDQIWQTVLAAVLAELTRGDSKDKDIAK